MFLDDLKIYEINPMDYIAIAKQVIQIEIDGLSFMYSHIDNEFIKSVNAILTTQGRTIVCGMGKSGIIGKKISASLASTGTPSFFMHPGEAFHGDLGMVKSEDIFIAISNSGETEEVLKLLPFLEDNNNYIIAITGNRHSTLARKAHCCLDISVPQEACPYQLAPTSSTTATLVMGDALTIALMDARDFQPESFARFHPGGSLGKKLLNRVKDEMIFKPLPTVKGHDDFQKIVNTISQGMLGICLVEGGNQIGVITDGDIRRAMLNYERDVFDLVADNIASYSPYWVTQTEMVGNAMQLMDEKKINALLVKDGEEFIGILKK